MKFRLTASNASYVKIEDCRDLLDLGMTAQPIPPGRYYDNREYVRLTDSWIEINSIEELLALHKRVGHELIVSKDEDELDPVIEIYNDYRE